MPKLKQDKKNRQRRAAYKARRATGWKRVRKPRSAEPETNTLVAEPDQPVAAVEPEPVAKDPAQTQDQPVAESAEAAPATTEPAPGTFWTPAETVDTPEAHAELAPEPDAAAVPA